MPKKSHPRLPAGLHLMTDGPDELVQVVSADPEQGTPEPGETPETLPILPVRNTVLFPGVVLPVTVTRKKSIRLVRRAYRGNKLVGVVAQKTGNAEDPAVADLYEVGTLARILKLLELPDGNTTIIIQGQQRFRIAEVTQSTPYYSARVEYLPELMPTRSTKEVKGLVASLKDAATKMLKLNPEIPQEAQVALDNIESPAFLIHFLASNLNVEVGQKQQLLEINEGQQRGTRLLELLLKEIQLLEIKHEIQNKVHTDLDQQQRDYFLRQQLKVLQDELGQEGPDQELDKLRLRAKDKKWPEAVAKHFQKELDKLGRMSPMAAEYPVSLNYAEFLLDLPWAEYTKDNFNLARTRKILDQDHYGLEKVKERILEYLAVLKLKQDLRAPILCLYGPPGVGKTSLGRSIATALGRKYVRLSLGGVRDEAEIRGHRKTYVGAMPGRIISQIKKAGASNPVMILDEVDKLSSDFRGDPQAALLEVLDPEQNSTFTDNYLEVEYDLSRVLFIATANSLESIHPALRDRMEIIDLTGYTLEEKTQIAKKHLWPKQVTEHGLTAKDVSISTAAVQRVIDDYTRESGVRSLERKLGALARNIAKHKAMKQAFPAKLEPEDVTKILGAATYDRDLYQDNDTAGVVTGLAWTSVGGDILFIESLLSRGRGKLTLSGQLGDVMKESAVTALSYLRSRAEELGIDYRLFDQYDLHIHFPEGAVPKDGPSAGIAIFTSIASVFTQRKVRSHLAMTGEITLRGKVLPVGGIKEKVLAAKRAGIKDIILSHKNRKDILEIPAEYVKDLQIHYADRVDDVLQVALLDELVPKPLKLVVREEEKAPVPLHEVEVQ
ncbi:endopeptidase La [Hymenobacter sp. 15J16-1T3B]|uniref:endopeptidase La n=1 Tax=Hymenobacter sp. 15J16-1T3B TaxID=2886941 RepID=UPI001D11B4E6|nr:endopeptidase La [Hymenobacter sp. 15J16-1T3B]MCC3157284.1 endopeptidase La [Hymenobacter sp. 15J16-1T3B]